MSTKVVLIDPDVVSILTQVNKKLNNLRVAHILSLKKESQLVVYIDRELNAKNPTLMDDVKTVKAALKSSEVTTFTSYLKSLVLKYPLLDKHNFIILSNLT